MAVRFRGTTVVGVLTGTDKYTGDALRIARNLKEQYGDRVYRAEIDRFDGLIIYWQNEGDFELNPIGDARGHHFVTPICGYMGSGPMASAQILELFGFGSKDEMLKQIHFGDNHAYFTFSKQSSNA